jgi:hypothetical protein
MNFYRKSPTFTFVRWLSRDRLSSEQTQRGERPARVRGDSRERAATMAALGFKRSMDSEAKKAGLGFPQMKTFRQGCHD